MTAFFEVDSVRGRTDATGSVDCVADDMPAEHAFLSLFSEFIDRQLLVLSFCCYTHVSKLLPPPLTFQVLFGK
jgi:hypothetical protein